MYEYIENSCVIEDKQDLRTNEVFQFLNHNLQKRNGFVNNYNLIEASSLIFNVVNVNQSHKEILKRVFHNGENVEEVVKEYRRKHIYKTFSYSGSKYKFKNITREALSDILSYDTNNKIDTLVSPCAGSVSGVISYSEILKSHGIKHLVLNDLNLTIINFFKNVKENIQELKNEVVNLIIESKDYLNDLCCDKEDYKILYQYFLEKLKEFEKNGLHSHITASALFYFLSRDSYNGIYKYDIENNFTKQVNMSPDDRSRLQIFLKNVLELDKISEFLNSFETVEFLTMDCIELVNRTNHLKNVIYDADPVYVKTESEDDLIFVGNNYGFEKESFDHKGFLEAFKGTNFIYFNNTHIKFDKYVEENDELSLTHIYKTSNSHKTKKGVSQSYTIECMICGSSNEDYQSRLSMKRAS